MGRVRRNPIGGARYMLRDLDDDDFALLLDASSGAEALVEARQRTGKRKGRYEVIRITDPALMNPRSVGKEAWLQFQKGLKKRPGTVHLMCMERGHKGDEVWDSYPTEVTKLTEYAFERDPDGSLHNITIRSCPDCEKKRRRKARSNPGPVEHYQSILAHLRAIQWLSWQLHWVSVGSSFYSDHQLLERLYSGSGGPDINEEIDSLGERMVYFFGSSSVNPVVISLRTKSLIEEAPNNLEGLFSLELSLQREVKRAWAANQSSPEMSLVLDDQLMGLANSRAAALYLLKQRISG